MADYFGYNKTAKGPGNIVSSTMVLASIDGEAVRLVQDCNIQYQRNAQFQYELGSDSVWSIAGQSSGTATMTRSVGDKKLLEPYQPGGPCELQNITVGKGNGECGMDPGKILCSGCLLISVGFQASSGGLTVTDNANWQVGSLTRS